MSKLFKINEDGSVTELCPYCQNDDGENELISGFAIPLKEDFLDVRIGKGTTNLNITYNHFDLEKTKCKNVQFLVDFNYCPKCGRKLIEQDK